MRTLTTDQATALQAYDRRTFVRVSVEDPDGNYVDMGDLGDSDFFDEATLEHSADQPISRGTFSFWRADNEESLAPLMEESPLNRDSTDAYAPMLNPFRGIRVEVATMLPGQEPDTGDWRLIWDGVIDDIDWARERVAVNARDRLAILNDTIIETVGTYGANDGSENIDAVMQQILDDNFGSSIWPLTVVGAPTFPILEYQLGNVSVLDALTALADLIGWSLHYRWDDSEGEFRLTLYEPDRSDTTASWTFGPDDYYDVTRAALGVSGIRNAGEVVYTDVNGVQQSVSDERTTSVAIYGRRFIRLDAQGTSIINGTQADALLASVLDDLESPKALQTIDAAFHWPLELDDVHTYTANGVHYDIDQTWACFAFSHHLSPERIRTTIQAAGKPSGGFARWHKLEATRVGAGRGEYDLRTTIRVETIPTVSGASRGATWDIHYDLGVDVTHVTWLAFVGVDLVDGGNTVPLNGTGTIRVGAFRTTGQLYVTMGARRIEGGITVGFGTSVFDLATPIEDIGATRLALSAGGVAVADYAVPGDGILIDADGAGRPRIRRDPVLGFTSGDAVTDMIIHEATVSWGTVAANSTDSETVTVTGAASGDAVLVTYRGGGWNAWPIMGYVSGSNQVTLVATNPETTGRTHDSVAVTIFVVKYTT